MVSFFWILEFYLSLVPGRHIGAIEYGLSPILFFRVLRSTAFILLSEICLVKNLLGSVKVELTMKFIGNNIIKVNAKYVHL